jgi:predicted dehydrogenase
MKTKWGVWGSAGIARRRTIPEGIVKADNAELVGVYDVNETANREVASQFGAKACASEDALLASEIDVVYIATPAYLHCDQVIRAAEAGKHVFCEKPLGMTVLESKKIVAARKAHGVKLGVGFMMRFHAQHQEALRRMQAGQLGTLLLGRAQLSCWYPPIEGAWRQDPKLGGGGSLMDLGGHCIDLLEMYFGPVTSVYCVVGNRVHAYPSEDTAVVLMEFASKATGTVDCLFNVPDESSRNRLELYGSKGSILAEGTIGQGEIGHMVAHLPESDQGYQAQQARDAGGGAIIQPEPVNMYRAEVEAFAKAVLDDTEPPVDGEAGLWSQKVLAACYESASTGRRMLIPR